jgi:hypothetical protein
VSGGDREGERKRFAADVSKGLDDIKTGVSSLSRDEPGGCPLIGQVVSGMEATRARSAASAWNGRKPERHFLLGWFEWETGSSPGFAGV